VLTKNAIFKFRIGWITWHVKSHNLPLRSLLPSLLPSFLPTLPIRARKPGHEALMHRQGQHGDGRLLQWLGAKR